MSNLDFNPGGGDALLEITSFNPRDRYPPYTSATNTHSTMAPNRTPGTWTIPLDMTTHHQSASSTTVSSPERSPQSQLSSPSTHSASPLQQSPTFSGSAGLHSPALLTDWTLIQHQQQHQFMPENTLIPFSPFTSGFQANAMGYLPTGTQAALSSGLQSFGNMSPIEDSQAMQQQWDGMGMGMANWQDFGASLQQFPSSDGLPRLGSMGSQSPTGTYLEVISLPGSSSDGGWAQVDMYHTPSYETFQQAQAPNAAIFNPGQTLHLRTNSDASHSDGSGQPLDFSSSYEEVFTYAPYSPESDSFPDAMASHRNCFHGEGHHSHDNVSPSAAVAPLNIKTSPSPSRSSTGSGSGVLSPVAVTSLRRHSGPTAPRKSPISKTTKSVTRRTLNGKKDGSGEKKVGRRKGPLLPEQRKQASEIRKLRACLRCKFLKKTCDTGEPCGGCQPSHARLWQVPCTRIDIKDIAYFMKDWKADYERHMGRGVSVYNVKGFAPKESVMWITHGYGFALPVMVREVFVADESCFQVDWIESYQPEQDPIEFEVKSERYDVGEAGIDLEALNEYLDKHIDGHFESFIDDHFEGTPFITEILKTAHRFYVKQKLPVIRKALKLVLAYNLTNHITLIEQQGSEEVLDGQIDDEDSKFYGKTVAPVMVNFQIKCAMADMWRDLQKEILEELSALYSSVYSGDRLKNWPNIFMLASILLAVWEEMQFDCHYRTPDPAAVEKFCTDMETVPVGVITGLFHAISQKLPALTDWDTSRHGHLLNNNTAVCEALTEVRQHVLKHEAYLRTRNTAKFDMYNFDSLSNKFLSKLVIKAN